MIKKNASTVVAALERQLADAIKDRDELQRVFDVRWKADMRAIKMWQKGHPERENVKHIWPDHADMVVWLMEQLDKQRKGKRQ